MFGLGLGEIIIVIVVALVVIGPKDLPKMLRNVGRWAGKLRIADDFDAPLSAKDLAAFEGA